MSCEVSWFAATCDEDCEYLGVPDPVLQSSWEHCRDLVMQAESLGYDNVLMPSGYQPGIDTTAFAAGIASWTRRIRLLMAVRIGENWPPQLARQLATIDGMAGGRLTVNVISSDMAGERIDSEPRYRRTIEGMAILRTLLDGKPVDHQGEFWNLQLDPPRVRTRSGRCPPFYFGGFSDAARDAAAEGADVFLMWPDRMESVRETIADLRSRAARRGRTLRFGYRVHVVVRETEDDARAAAARLLSRLDDHVGAAIRKAALDTGSAGVSRQAELRGLSNTDGYIEDNLWTGVGRARSGCGAAIVGDPDQVFSKLNAYRELGIEAFILSGYPHAAEADLFARHVLPRLDHGPLDIHTTTNRDIA
jgi:alkanesulfonate monooxygenase